MHIWGTRGEIKITEKYRKLILRCEEQAGEKVYQDFELPKPMIMEYLDALVEDREPLFSGRRGIESTHAALAAQLSADEERTVALL